MTFDVASRVNRYPAKMFPPLVNTIFESGGVTTGKILDPFCGSGEVLMAARARGMSVSGIDLNPYATLLSRVRCDGFPITIARKKLSEVFEQVPEANLEKPINWKNKHYWFTPAVLAELEIIRSVIYAKDLYSSMSGRAVILALTQSIRICSKADNRSPKTFISKHAKKTKHSLQPSIRVIATSILEELATRNFSGKTAAKVNVLLGDTSDPFIWSSLGRDFDYIVTSPPYINAQDYFRNFKLESYFLEGIIPFEADQIKPRFIGTERNLKSATHLGYSQGVSNASLKKFLADPSVPGDAKLIVNNYLGAMNSVAKSMVKSLRKGGTVWMVLGDNHIRGHQIQTSKIVTELLELNGFSFVSEFRDQIRNRAVAPTRMGHTGIIKEEVIICCRK
jgi:DNA modification methylase